ncbi:beta strand repeat-containing protein [Rhizobium sp. No.120]
MNLKKLLLAASLACAFATGAFAQSASVSINNLPSRSLSYIVGHDGSGSAGREPVTDFLKPATTSPTTGNLACWGTTANLITDCGAAGSMSQQNANAVAITGGAATFTGVTTAPTKSQGDNSTNVATTAYVDIGLGTKAGLVGGVVPVAQGGTGAPTAAGARSALGAAASGANADITSLSNLTTPLSVAQGGTGTTTSTGTGSVVRGTAPSIFNPTLTGTVTIGGVTQVFPASGLLAGTSDTQTFTGKTFDTGGSGNVFKINGTQISAVTGTGSAVLAINPTISGAALSGGSINNAPIGATIPNTGSFTTLALSGATTQSATSQFYQNFGANVNRVNDRLFVGPAALNNGTNVASQPDWLTQYQLAKGRTYGYVQTSQLAVLNASTAKDSLTTAVFGAQTTGRTTSGSQVIAATGIGVNNNYGNTGAAGNQAWGGYFEGWRDTSTAGNGGAYGIEADSINLVGVADTDPYLQSSDQTVSAQLASGGEIVGAFDATAAVNIQNNGAAYRKGIVIGSNAISGDDGTTGVGIAVALAKGHTIQWYALSGGVGVPTSSILSNGTNQAAGISELFSDNIVSFRNASGKAILNIQGVASGVNGVQALGAATGQAVAVQAVGDDTNIPIQIQGKGTGDVRIKGAGTNSNAQTGDVGEYVSNSTTGVSLTSATTANITSISLTAGDWDVTGTCTFVPANTTAPTLMQCGASTTSATLGGLGQNSFLGVTFPTNGQSQGFVAPRQRISVASTTTVYLVGQSSFTVSTMTANGFISARRVR